MKTALFVWTLIATFTVFSGMSYAGNVSSNQRGVVHKGSDGMSVVFPDVCKTPPSGSPIPIPYPNTGKASDTSKGSKKVKMGGQKTKYKNYFKKSAN